MEDEGPVKSRGAGLVIGEVRSQAMCLQIHSTTSINSPAHGRHKSRVLKVIHVHITRYKVQRTIYITNLNVQAFRSRRFVSRASVCFLVSRVDR